MMVRLSRAAFAVLLAMPALVAACKKDDPTQDDQIRQYCDDLFASPAFACCNGADQAQRAFAARHGYTSSSDCADQLLRAAGQSQGRRVYDAKSAGTCLGYLAARPCKTLPTSAVRAEEEKQGCNRVVIGTQGLGKPCNTSEECALGLFCPPVKDTGTATCTRPAAATESCFGDQGVTASDHPYCQPGLFCSLVGDNAGGCPTPPCLDFRCVPFFEEGEPCTGLECAAGLGCADGFCRKGAPNTQGSPCTVSEFCAEGLYCDPNHLCSPKKNKGEACRNVADAFECRGACDGDRCVNFCGQ
jgi:hypothetical protein